MANITLTNLPTVTGLNGTEPLLGVQNSTSVQITTGQIVSLSRGGAGILPLPVIAGGTGDATLTSFGLLYGNGTNPVGVVSPPAGTNYVLIGSAGSAPTWQPTIPVTAGVDSISFGTTGLTPSTDTAGIITVAGTLAAKNGGTGQSSYTIGDLLYASSSTALSKLSDVATGSILVSGGVGVAPSYSSSPTLTTSLTTPLLIGGTTASSTLTLESTSGTGTSDSIIFKTGSQVTAMTIGTAQNINIGTGAAVVGQTLRVNKNLTGATTSYSVINLGSVLSDVTTTAYGYYSSFNTQAASFTLPVLSHYSATQGTVGIGSQITTQYGYQTTATLIGATNNYGMYSNIPSVTTATISNVAADGTTATITTSAAHGYGTGQSVIVAATTNTSLNGTFTITSVPSTTTFTYTIAVTIASTADTGSTYVNTGRYNFYAAGSAPNLFQGSLAVGNGNNTGGVALSATSAASFRSSSGTSTTYTDIVSSGTVGTAPISLFQGMALAARNTVTYTTAATLYITGAPTAGTNVTIPNPYALYVAAGASYFGGAVTSNVSETVPLIIGGTTASSTLTLESTSGAGTTDSIIFKTGSQSTAMTINTSGNVGIGTTSPTAKLHVLGNNGTNGTSAFFSISSAVSGIAIVNNGTIGGIQGQTTPTGTNTDISINANGGNVGIGTTSPNSRLQVTGSFVASTVASYPVILGGGSFGGGVGLQDSTGVSGFYTQSSGTQLLFFTGQTSADSAASKVRLLIDSFGLTMSTGTALIGGTAVSATLTLESTSGAGTSDAILFKTGSQVERMRIDTSGNVSIGSSGTSTGVNLLTNAQITGATSAYAHYNNGSVQSGVTSLASAYVSNISLAAASFTTNTVTHFWANPGSGGAGSTITNQYGFLADTTVATQGAASVTNAYGFFGNMAAASNRWNLYMGGTANNYMAGALGVGTTSVGAAGTITASSTISDSIGNVRTIVQNSQTSAYVLVATDNGKYISITTGGVTVPASIFTAGQNIVIYNQSSSVQTITQGASVTMTLAGSTTTGNRSLAANGVATVLCTGSNTFVITGQGLT